MMEFMLLASVFLLGVGVGGLYGLHLGRRALRRVEAAYQRATVAARERERELRDLSEVGMERWKERIISRMKPEDGP